MTENVLEYSFRNVLNIIEKYILFNPDLKDYSKQQYTITNPHFFSNILENFASAYWFGFFCADGWVTKERYQIGMELSIKDEDHLKKFADFIGFEQSRLYHRTRFLNYRGEIRSYKLVSINFVCRPMSKILNGLGVFGSKDEIKGVPLIIKKAIELAKKEAQNINKHWSDTFYGKIAHAWLLGFYDGDGHYFQGYTVEVGSASKDLLQEIKELFEIPHQVGTKIEPGDIDICFNSYLISKGYYRLTLSPTVFNRMLNSYQFSLNRKRPS